MPTITYTEMGHTIIVGPNILKKRKYTLNKHTEYFICPPACPCYPKCCRLAVYVAYFGGIYLDTDVLILKSFDPLRKYNLVLGRATKTTIANGIMIARKGALFLRLWLENYRNYNRDIFGGNSVVFSNLLQKLYPHLVYVELDSLLGPTYRQLEYMYGINNKFFDWSKSLSIHIFGENQYRVPGTPEQLKGFNSTLGQVMRYIYFGSPNLLPITGKRFTANKPK